MPTRPQLATAEAAKLQLKTWDQYVEEVVGDVEPWQLQLPDGTLLEPGFPTSDQMDSMNDAQRRQDSKALVVAIFGADQGAAVLELTAKAPFTVRMRLCNDVVQHYLGKDLGDLPES